MYKVITINNKDYKLEYSIEASLYSDCAESIITLMDGMSNKKDTAEVVHNVLNIPDVALTLFYAGLIEHHGADGDGTVTSKASAKNLIKMYLSEHKGEDSADFWGILNMCIDQMAEDGFFKLIGLETMLNSPKKAPKVPMDHKSPTKK